MILSAFFLSVLVTACATSGQSTLAGMGIGAGLGGAVGAIADGGAYGQNRIRNVFIGSTAGSLLGAGTGYLTHDTIRKAKSEAYQNGKKDGQKEVKLSTSSSREPVLIPPRVEARYVEDQVRGGTFIPGHVEYQIVEPAKWSK